MNNLTDFELAVECCKIALAGLNILINIILLVKAERLIYQFYACPCKAEVIKGTERERGVFDNRSDFFAAILVWFILVVVLVYWTASKLNVVPVSADIGILTSILGFTLKDTRKGLCSFRNIRRLLQLRASDWSCEVIKQYEK